MSTGKKAKLFFKKYGFNIAKYSYLALTLIFLIIGIVDQATMFLIKTASVGPLSVFTVLSLVFIVFGIIAILAINIKAKGGQTIEVTVTETSAEEKKEADQKQEKIESTKLIEENKEAQVTKNNQPKKSRKVVKKSSSKTKK